MTIDETILDINLGRLEEHWRDMPKKFHTYAKKLTDARDRERRCEVRLKRVIAEAELAVRSDPGTYGLLKPTEGAIDAVVLTMTSVQEAQEELLEVTKEVSVLGDFVRALTMMKDSLENEVKLFGMDYFSKPRADLRTKEEVTKVRNEIAKSQNNLVRTK